MVLSLIIAGTLWTLKYPLGRKINERADAFSYLQGYREDDLLPLTTEESKPGTTLELLGYKASRNVMFTFSLLFVIAAVCWQFWKPWRSKLLTIIAHLFSNPLFAACATIVAIGVLERGIPFVLWRVVNKLILMRKWCWKKAIERERRALGLPA